MDAQLRNEIAQVRRDFLTFSGVLGHVELNPDDTLRTRGYGLGLKIYDQIERDSHAYAVLQKRKMAVIRLPWEVKAASGSPADVKAAELVKDIVDNLAISSDPKASELGLKGFDGVCLAMLDAILKGYAVAEIMWLPGAETRVDRILPRDQRRFGFAVQDNGWELRLLTRENQANGEAVPPKKFIVHTFGDKDGNPHGVGLGTRLFWNVFFKRQDIQFWLFFADKFGSPTPIGKYPVGSTPDQIKILNDALRAITQGTTMAIPEGMVIELLEAVRSGTDTHEKLCRYMDEQVSECVLGETGSTNQSGNGGSRARDEVGNSTRLELTQADSDLLSETWNRTLCRWVTEINYPNAKPPKIWRSVPQVEDLEGRSNREKNLFTVGFRLTPEKFAEIYGEGYELIQTSTIPEMSTIVDSPGQVEFAEAPKPDTIDLFTNRVRQQAGQVTRGWINQIEALLDECADMAEFAERLPEIYPELNPEKMVQIMSEGMVASRLAGMYEAQQRK